MPMTFRVKCTDVIVARELERVHVSLQPIDRTEDSPGLSSVLLLRSVHHELFFEGKKYLVQLTPLEE